MKGPVAGFRGHLLTVLAVAGFAGGWLLLLLSAGGERVSLGGRYEVRALVRNAASLAANARVTMAGVEVGRVVSVRRRGLGALVTLAIEDDSVTPLPADSRVAVRQRTPVGENYVSIEAGRSRTPLRAGGLLPAGQSDEYVDVDQILSVLQGGTRRRARDLLRGFGGAVDDRGEQLNALLGGTSRAITAGERLTAVLSRDREHVSRLVDQLGAVARAVGERGDAMRTLARDGLVTFRATAQRDAALRALLDELPSTLDQVRRTSGTLGTVSERATPVLADLAGAVRDLRPAVRLLGPAAGEGRGVLRELGAAAPGLERTLARVRGAAGPTAGAMPPVQDTLCQLNPALRYLKPYARDVTALLVGLSSAMNSYDAVGHLVRVSPVITEQVLTGLPKEVHQAVRTLIRSGLLQQTRAIGYDPYPPPGAIGTNPDGKGVLGPAEVTKKYPRIHADC